MLGANIRAKRKALGWTQLQLADKLGVGKSTVSQYETDTNEPDIKMLSAIADAFKCTVDDLFGRTRATSEYLQNPNAVLAPVVAEIACGEPTFAEDSIIDYFPINPLMVNTNDGPYVWVIAKGDSMIGAGIKDGSLVLIRLQSTVNSGDIAAVCIDNETATMKRVYFLSDGRVRLQPENAAYQARDCSVEDIRIVGKAVSFITKSE